MKHFRKCLQYINRNTREDFQMTTLEDVRNLRREQGPLQGILTDKLGKKNLAEFKLSLATKLILIDLRSSSALPTATLASG